MNDLFLIAGGAGLQDGLNPCIFMACAVFIMNGFWLKRRSFQIGPARLIFALAYALGVLVFNFGPVQALVLNKYFIFAAQVLYFILGLGSLIAGVLFFKDWVSLRRGLSVEDRAGKEIKSSAAGNAVVCLTAIIFGLALSALATIWPVNKYIIILGNAAIIKGQWQTVMPLLVSYALVSMWGLWFVWAFLSIKNLKPSLLKIICSAVFFTASSCMILIFK